MNYLIIKWLHILSSTILFGTGIGSAFYMFVANRRKLVAEIYFATKYVVMADWVFTLPAIVIQLITGLMLVKRGGFNLADGWLIWSLGLYALAVICWLIVVCLQINMRDLAITAMVDDNPLPKEYWRMELWWIILGFVALPAMIAIFYLMVIKI